MRILVQPATLAEPKWFPIFDVILLLVEDERHSIAVEGLPHMLKSNWLSTRQFADRDLIRLASLKRATDALVDASMVIIDDTVARGGVVNVVRSETSLHPLDAIMFLSMPFQVIVENEWYDGGFLLWMAKALGFEKFLTAHRQRRFSFRHAGGKTSMARSAQILSTGVWPRNDGRYTHARRLWSCAILDNDARFAGDDPNAAIRAAVDPHVTFVRQLRRRSIESYLPQAVMLRVDASAAHHDRVGAWFRLSDQQRTYYNMKAGFRFEQNLTPSNASYMASAAVRPEEKVLFGGIPAIDWPRLREGFGRKLASCYVENDLRPNLNDSMAINPDDRAELTAIIEAIYKRI